MHEANKATERLKAVSLLFPGETGGWKFSKNPQKQVASLSLCLTHSRPRVVALGTLEPRYTYLSYHLGPVNAVFLVH